MREFIETGIGGKPRFLPFIRGRLDRVNGTPVADLKVRNVQGQQFIRREQNLTWTGTLPASNSVPAASGGARTTTATRRCRSRRAWPASSALKLGDSMTFNVGGEEFRPRSRASATSNGTPSRPTSS